jgi:hypothetical protein
MPYRIRTSLRAHLFEAAIAVNTPAAYPGYAAALASLRNEPAEDLGERI